jgi:hypothetical protein
MLSTIEVSGLDSNAHKSACVRLAKVICGVGVSFVTLGKLICREYPPPYFQEAAPEFARL